jgi:hypothetical protein
VPTVVVFSNSSAAATATAATYGAPATGTAASVSVAVTSGQKVLISLYTQCANSNAAKGCYMSFDASGVAGVTNTASDTTAVGSPADSALLLYTSGATFAFTATGSGTLTVTAKYRRIANTATFNAHNITVMVVG